MTTKRRDTRKRRRVTNKIFFVSLLYSMSTYTLSNQSPASRLIYLDSRDGFPLQINSVTGESLSTYFKYTLDESISIPAQEDVLVSLHSVSIPNSFYTIRKGINDSVKVILDGENLIDFKKPYTFTITIPQGNYRQPYEVQSAHWDTQGYAGIHRDYKVLTGIHRER